MTVSLNELYNRLLEAYGPQGWWPGETPLEVMVGAVLTQNTAWKNVERAILNLREDALLSVAALDAISQEELAETIRPAGYFRLKSRRLKNLVEFVVGRYGGSLDAMFSTELDRLREELLQINGIGPETADSILLYAGELPTFVVDNYTARVLKRHGWIEADADYYAIQSFCEDHLAKDTRLYNELHALLVRVGNEFCRKIPQCDDCPLREWLPEGGPLGDQQ